MEIGRESIRHEVRSALGAIGEIPLQPSTVSSPKSATVGSRPLLGRLEPEYPKPTGCRPTDVPGLVKILSGDDEGWAPFLHRFMPDLKRWSKELLESNPLQRLGYSGEDLACETVFALYENDCKALKDFDGRASMKGYLYSIMENKFKDLVKKQSAACRGGTAQLAMKGAAADLGDDLDEEHCKRAGISEWTGSTLRPDRLLFVKELDCLMIEGIRSIGPPYGETLELRYRGYSREEIAGKTDKNIRTVDSDISRGKEKLEKAIRTKRHEGLRHAIPKGIWDNFVEKIRSRRKGQNKE